MDRRTGCQAPAGSSGTGHCCPLTVGAPRLGWLAQSLCSVTWPDCHRGLGYVEAGLLGEAPGGREVWGALGSRAQAVGWVAGAVEGAAMAAARARRASEGARAPRPGLTLDHVQAVMGVEPPSPGQGALERAACPLVCWGLALLGALGSLPAPEHPWATEAPPAREPASQGLRPQPQCPLPPQCPRTPSWGLVGPEALLP